MDNRYTVFSEDMGGETHWGIYDEETGSVLEWYETKDEAELYLCVPDNR